MTDDPYASDEIIKVRCPYCNAVIDRYHVDCEDYPEAMKELRENAKRRQKKHSESGDCKFSVN